MLKYMDETRRNIIQDNLFIGMANSSMRKNRIATGKMLDTPYPWEKKKAIFSMFIMSFYNEMNMNGDIMKAYADFLYKPDNRKCLSEEAFTYFTQMDVSSASLLFAPLHKPLNALCYAALVHDNVDAKKALLGVYKKYYKKEYNVIKKWRQYKIDDVIGLIPTRSFTKPVTINKKTQIAAAVMGETDKIFDILDKMSSDKVKVTIYFELGHLCQTLVMLHFLGIPEHEHMIDCYDFIADEYKKAVDEIKVNDEYDADIEKVLNKLYESRYSEVKGLLSQKVNGFKDYFEFSHYISVLVNIFNKKHGYNRDIMMDEMSEDGTIEIYIQAEYLLNEYEMQEEFKHIGVEEKILLGLLLHASEVARTISCSGEIYHDHLIKSCLTDESIENTSAEKGAHRLNYSPAIAEKYKKLEAQVEELQEIKYQNAQKDMRIKELEALLDEEKQNKLKASKTEEEINTLYREVISLREFVYNMTEDGDTNCQDPKCIDTTQMDTFIEKIGNKSVCLLGGNPNWIYKLKNKFPKWKFYKADVSAIDEAAIKNADYVYFFSGCLSHKNYNHTIRIIKEHNVPFGYIANINIERNMEQFYNDLKGLVD